MGQADFYFFCLHILATVETVLPLAHGSRVIDVATFTYKTLKYS